VALPRRSWRGSGYSARYGECSDVCRFEETPGTTTQTTHPDSKTTAADGTCASAASSSITSPDWLPIASPYGRLVLDAVPDDGSTSQE